MFWDSCFLGFLRITAPFLWVMEITGGDGEVSASESLVMFLKVAVVGSLPIRHCEVASVGVACGSWFVNWSSCSRRRCSFCLLRNLWFSSLLWGVWCVL